MKRQHSINERIEFAKGLPIVLKYISDNFVKEECKEEYQIFIENEFKKVPKFSDTTLLENMKTMTENKLKDITKLKKERKLIEVKEKIYNNISKSLIVQYCNEELNIDLSKNMESCFDEINVVTQKIKQKNTEIIYYYVIIGAYFQNIKDYCEKNNLSFKLILETRQCGYGKSTVYFSIQLYKFCIEYPKVQYLALPFNYIQSNWKSINKIVSDDSDFWNII